MDQPSIAQIRSLPLVQEQEVPDSFIDENGHMNILRYIELGTGAAWRHLKSIATGEDYIADRGLSFFTVGHHIDYLGELRLGERLAVHTGFSERSDKAVRGLAAVLDLGRERVAALVEVKYVHIAMGPRRPVSMPEDVAAAIDADVEGHSWLAAATPGLRLSR